MINPRSDPQDGPGHPQSDEALGFGSLDWKLVLWSSLPWLRAATFSHC